MFDVLLPQEAGNDFRGHKSGLWILAVVLLLLAAMSVNSIFNGHYVATQADGLPLGSFSAVAAHVVIMFYAVLGVTQLTVVLFGIAALMRYRGLVPLVFLLLLAEQVSWRIVHHVLPVSTQGGTGGSWFIYGLMVLIFIGFVLSLWRRGASPEAASEHA